nr:diguanylate cyclase [Deinococcus humi]
MLNFALLVTGVFLLSLTSTLRANRNALFRLLVRYLGAVSVAFLLLLNTVQVAPGLLLDLRAVIVALAAQRHGFLAGLLVAIPVALYRLLLAGAGAGPSVLGLLLITALFSWRTGLFRTKPNVELLPWWRPLVLFGLTSLTTFLGFTLAGKSLLEALPVYLAMTCLSVLGLLTAQAVDQTRLRALARTEHLEQLVYLDPLTGAFNRRRFDDDLGHPEPPAFLLLLDLDHFKRVNDTYGHEAGDQVLAATVQVLQETVRLTDSVYRLGGEEFAVLLSPCAPDAAFRMSERVRHAVARDVAPRAGLSGEQVTVSGGLIPVAGLKRDILRAADDLLYSAKRAGRNCILVPQP